MDRKQLIQKYLKFFESKGHRIIPNASLIPKDDPTVLFTTAGMHPLIPYLLGQKHPLGKKLVNVQKCIRTTDIEEVGNKTHHTFFEMLGNWSLGDYWKKEAIEMSFEFLTKILKIDSQKISVTCFAGDKDAPRDTESAKIWKSLGIKKIKFLGKKDNWWGPAGKTGPCGPCTEMFVNGSEIGNDVLMEYDKDNKGHYNNATQKNIDFGGGVERTLAVLNDLDDNYMTEVWKPMIDELEHLSGKKYKGNEKAMRIIADHIKAAVFMIADGITPSNTEQGYVLRRLIRKSIMNFRKLGREDDCINELARIVYNIYPDYRYLHSQKNHIYKIIKEEGEKFKWSLNKGLIVFDKLIKNKKTLSGKDAFLLYQSYGFPIELTEELAKEKKIKISKKGFEQELAKHQKLSQKASAGKFKSGLADHSEKTTKLHTTTHILNEALRRVLDKNVKQRGSNITSERLRFDFNFPRKLTEQEIKKVEDLVNKKITESIPVKREEMPLKKALASGIQSEFGARYPDIVGVYSIGNFSREICAGPHVKNTLEIGKFKILKEESSAAGIRRIKAVIE
ncbi:MAG TPA: alanine--tRNA ligase-related protein [Bacillota bacterium]|nr:alanine--tRNA ligase-related protein [Bacillota bacterium]